ncbi:hypothetical protein [Synechococcus sp. M16CYN]|uniref:hypothetical protein n=1 Tax=Synechococcus sp. M16CYN TaxID=3103139 RepID=UPI0033422207
MVKGSHLRAIHGQEMGAGGRAKSLNLNHHNPFRVRMLTRHRHKTTGFSSRTNRVDRSSYGLL